jgi:uroporphyrinogen decarboxylase
MKRNIAPVPIPSCGPCPVATVVKAELDRQPLGESAMNSYERVNTALRRQGLPDRVPLQFDLSRPLLEAFSQQLDIPIGWQPNYYEDLKYRTSGNEIRVAMGSDCVLVGGGPAGDWVVEEDDEGVIVNEFGMKMKMGLAWYDVIEGPLEQCSSVEEVKALPFPDPADEARFEDARRYIERYKGDYFVIGDVELTMFEMAWHMTGLQKFMTDLALGEPYIEALIDRTMAWSVAIGKRLVELGVHGIWTGDDFGAQNGMMVSPDMWRRIFKPRMAEVFQEFRRVNPDVLVMYHCDGAIAPILPDLIEIGLDVFNPVQPGVPGHEPQALKDQFGSELSFWGAIDQQQLLPNGTPAEIEADVKAKIETLGAGGGYMVAPAHILQRDTPLENVEAMIEAVKTHGVY